MSTLLYHFSWHSDDDDDDLQYFKVMVYHLALSIDDTIFKNDAQDLEFHITQVMDCMEVYDDVFQDNTDLHSFMGQLLTMLPVEGMILLSVYIHDDALLGFLRKSLESSSDKIRAPGILRIGGYPITLIDWFGPWPYGSSFLLLRGAKISNQ